MTNFHMKSDYFEIGVGIGTIIFSVIFVLQVLKLTNHHSDREFYQLFARFENAEGIIPGAKIKVGGVEIGTVKSMELDKGYNIVMALNIRKDIKIPTDSGIKISTSGIMGGKYLKVSIGGDDRFLKPGNSFEFSESTLDLEDMITRFMLNGVAKK